ncbi:unnamed protein product [Anisakis simplex]|uniref:Protein-tyrosine phosphatase n=1 Tax=Anisakis simplex TaxID=6269 RepID=A0A0M3JSR2_ANISI|nr:unnamed protein product [Anisakis simplex]
MAMKRGLVGDDDPLAGIGLDEEDRFDDRKDLSTPKALVDEIAKNGVQATNWCPLTEKLIVQTKDELTVFWVINNWHNEILKEPPKFDAFLEEGNTLKNRFPNVILYDKTRVKLKGKSGQDYYHASYVDSYEKARDYILAQAPFDSTTEFDFWRLVYQVRPRLIVLLTAIEDKDGTAIIRKFFPAQKQQRDFGDAKPISVQCVRVDQDKDTDTCDIRLIGPGQRSNTALKIPLIHYKKWVDDNNIPDNLLEFRALVKIANAKSKKNGRTGPMIIVCPSGVHRCGTFAVLDIVLDRLSTEKKVGLLETTNIVRNQRYGCMTYFSHYNHIADLIVRQAVSSGIANVDCIGNKA